MKKLIATTALLALPAMGAAEETRGVWLEEADGARIPVGTLTIESDGHYRLAQHAPSFADHFLSMRPFKCIEGPKKHWCHVDYPYENRRNIAQGYTDLEYDLLFIWKGATEYGINMWNGVYYKIEEGADGRLVGQIHEMDMDKLGVPPEAGNLRPIEAKHLHEADPDSHWLPRLVIE